MDGQASADHAELDVGRKSFSFREREPRSRWQGSDGGANLETLTLPFLRGRGCFAGPERFSDAHLQGNAAAFPDLRGAAPPAFQRQSGNFDYRRFIQSRGTDAALPAIDRRAR